MASRDINDLTPEAAQKCRAFLAAAEAKLAPLGLRLLVTCTYRSQKEQDALYALGRTTPGKIVTWTRRSVHTKRRAWDVVFQNIKTGRLVWDGPWDELGKIAADLDITWGGAWPRCKDRPHFQMG
jgi:peptidoglycan L-alanyl-D-glutamate endopeptidase CwlK